MTKIKSISIPVKLEFKHIKKTLAKNKKDNQYLGVLYVNGGRVKEITILAKNVKQVKRIIENNIQIASGKYTLYN